ncbi:MAG: hypothetical protein V3S70_08305, partial [Gammaproteobacteria bacterium]
MKVTKYLAIALAIVAILASIAWFLRGTIIQRISNPILLEYGLEVTDVSLDALATSNATVSYLELEHENGTTIAIDDLTLPIGKSPTGIKTFTAEKVTIVASPASDIEPLAMAQVIGQLLLLPNGLPNTVVDVAQFSMAPYSTVRDLQWVTTETKQTLTASMDSIDLSAEVVRIAHASYEGLVSVRDASGTSGKQSITVSIQQTNTGISLSGASALDLPAWTSILTSISASLGITPASVEVETGAAELQFDAEILNDARRTASVNAYITLSTPLQFTYSGTPDVVSSVSIESASPIELKATFPQVQWSINQQQA